MVVQQLQRVHVGDAVLEYQSVGSGEPVVLVHGSHIADAVVPLLNQPALADRYRLVSYHRQGFAGSTHPSRPLSIADHAADCRGLIRALGIERAHIVGYSFGGVIALQLALDAPDAVHSLALLEPPLLFVPSAQQQMALIGAAVGMYQAGDKAGAVDAFMRAVLGPDYRAGLEKTLPGSFEQAVNDADTFFTQELHALPAWRFGPEQARQISQPVLDVLGADSAALDPSAREGYDVLLQWLPRAEGFVLPGATHALQAANPRGMAEALADFFARHPLSTGTRARLS